MRVEFLENKAVSIEKTIRVPFQAGQISDLPDPIAKELIEAKTVKAVNAPKKKAKAKKKGS